MKTVLNINIDSELKKEFQLFAKELGTNPTNLLNMMIKEALRNWSVSFWRDAWIVEDKEWVSTLSKITGEERTSFILW